MTPVSTALRATRCHPDGSERNPEHGYALRRWRSALWFGIASSSYSTLISQLAAARVGRDASVDWMVVATIPLRDAALSSEPTWGALAAGILFHQWADISWALLFFGVFGRWTVTLTPQRLALIATPWALLTSWTEWTVLVPLLPFRQPIFTLEQVYWIGFLVHLSSSALYPLYPWMRERLTEPVAPRARFAAIWGGLALGALTGLALIAALGGGGHEPRWSGRDQALDQSYMRRMAEHHRQGIVLAEMGVERANNPHLKALARLMAAAQTGDNRIFDRWWASWFGGVTPPCSAQDRTEMPGMLTPQTIDTLRQTDPASFDEAFIDLMTIHHRGAIQMSDAQMRGGHDPRLRFMAYAIHYAQQGEIALMNGVTGVAAVREAVRNLFPERVSAP